VQEGIKFSGAETVERLRATFRAAMDFGLTDEEVWAVVNAVCARVPDSRPPEASFDELANALADMILERRHRSH
jgi:hypothetical protein